MNIYDLLEMFIDEDDQKFYLYDNMINEVVFVGTKNDIENAELDDILYYKIDSIDNIYNHDARLCINVSLDSEMGDRCLKYMEGIKSLGDF